jgi:beta-glucosidase
VDTVHGDGNMYGATVFPHNIGLGATRDPDLVRDVYVAGSNANNIGNQAGGWTLTWQGGSTNVIPGTTILDGIRSYARHATFSADASAPIPHGALGIVVVGETPYSEGFGDVFGPQWAYDPGDGGVPRPVKDMQLSAADKAAVDKVCAATARCVMVVADEVAGWGGPRVRPAPRL